MSGRRIVTVESDPQVISELCRYDQGEVVDLSERALLGLDMITTPKADYDDTATALGFVALVRKKHPSTGLPPEQNPQVQILVSANQPFFDHSRIDGFAIRVPDGIFTLIPA